MTSFADRQVFDFDTYTKFCQECGVNWQVRDGVASRYVNNITAEQTTELRALYSWADRTDPNHSLRTTGMKTATTPTKTKKVPHWGYAALMIVAFVLPSPMVQFRDVFASYAPPVQYRDARMAKPVFALDEPIEFIVSYRRERVCSTTIERRIMSVVDGVTVHTARSFAPVSKVNAAFEELHIIVADLKLPKGDYEYSGVTHSDCGNTGAFNEPHGDGLKFSVR